MIIYRPFSVLLNTILKGTRRTINFITGSNITLTVDDNQANDRVDVTVASSSGVSGLEDTVEDETTFGISPAPGSSSKASRGDHTHGSPTDPVPAHEAAGDPHIGYQKESEKNQVNGYCGLDGAADVPLAQIPTPLIGKDADSVDTKHFADIQTEIDNKITTHEGAVDPHTGYQKESEKDAASGYCGLDAGSLVPLARIPATLTGKDADTVDTKHAADLEQVANKDQANGYAGLDAGSRILWARKPAFRGALVKRLGVSTIPNSTPIIINWHADEYDTDNIHSIVSNTDRLYVPAGVTKVRLTANGNWANNSTGTRALFMQKNGNNDFIGMGITVQSAQDTSDNNISSAVLTVTGGDYFLLYVYQSSGGNLAFANDQDRAWFAMEIIE